MRRLGLIVICCATFQLMVPTPAQAWWGWLDQLTGPGPFTGYYLHYRLACIQDKDLQPSNDIRPIENASRSLHSFGRQEGDKTEVGKREVAAAILGAGCLFQPKANPIASLNFRISQLWSVDNRLQYAGGAKVPTVTDWQFEPSFSTFVDRRKLVQLTTGLGLMVFSGDGFDTFKRFYFRPLEVTISPGAVKGEDSRATRDNGTKFIRALSLSLGFVIIPKGFDAADFGAMPGTFHVDKDILTTATITLDLSRF
jgi:hypothetical protein